MRACVCARVALQSVTPVGSDCDMPVYLSHHVDQLDYFWMGGGAVNLKLKVDTELFKKAYSCAVGLVTVATDTSSTAADANRPAGADIPAAVMMAEE